MNPAGGLVRLHDMALLDEVGRNLAKSLKASIAVGLKASRALCLNGALWLAST
jgi:hypothetical protein